MKPPRLRGNVRYPRCLTTSLSSSRSEAAVEMVGEAGSRNTSGSKSARMNEAKYVFLTNFVKVTKIGKNDNLSVSNVKHFFLFSPPKVSRMANFFPSSSSHSTSRVTESAFVLLPSKGRISLFTYEAFSFPVQSEFPRGTKVSSVGVLRRHSPIERKDTRTLFYD